jgi:DNA polymerase-1
MEINQGYLSMPGNPSSDAQATGLVRLQNRKKDDDHVAATGAGAGNGRGGERMPYYDEVVQHLQWAVMDIQMAGILVDLDMCSQLIAKAEAQRTAHRETLERCFGYQINPASPKQVIEMFKQDLGIDVEDSNVITLLQTTIKHPTKPIVEGIIEHREMTKLIGTYLKPTVWPDSRMRSSFRTYGTLTWRLSSKEPDMQNQPRGEVQGINVKDIYKAPAGFHLVELDYSALEDRIPSYASGCTKLINMFERGENTHLYRAGLIFGKPIRSKKEFPKEYDFAKRLRYSRGYGASVKTVCLKMLEDTHEWHPEEEIAPMLKAMDDDVPEIMAWHNKCWADAERTGMLYDGFGVPRTLFEPPGRRRQVAYSSPTQTTASGIMNRAMVRIYQNRDKFHPDTRIICQVHDSLLMEVREELVREETLKMKTYMERQVEIFGKKVSFPVEAKAGLRWGSMKELTL